jgi:hypothetical protein
MARQPFKTIKLLASLWPLAEDLRIRGGHRSIAKLVEALVLQAYNRKD